MRIGINVPNELMKQVKAIRPQVIVSKVCRQALEDHVEVAERAMSQAIEDGLDEQVNQLVKCLRNPLIEPDWENYALEDARDWVRAITPELWEDFVEEYDWVSEDGMDVTTMASWLSVMIGVKGFYVRENEHRDWFSAELKSKFKGPSIGKSDNLPNIYDKPRRVYARAWLNYVNEARRKLERHWKDEYERVVAEREEYRLSLPDPEPPPQLINERWGLRGIVDK